MGHVGFLEGVEGTEGFFVEAPSETVFDAEEGVMEGIAVQFGFSRADGFVVEEFVEILDFGTGVFFIAHYDTCLVLFKCV